MASCDVFVGMSAASSLILPVTTLFCTGLVESALSSESTVIEPPDSSPMASFNVVSPR